VYPDLDFFKERCISTPSGCWEWVKARIPDGYGYLRWEGRQWLTHRLAFMAAGGYIPPGHVVRHACDNPPCCNPEHLLSGTYRDNYQDMVDRGRRVIGQNVGDNLKNAPRPKGPEHYRAKFTADQIREIRSDPRPGKHIAPIYGCTQQAISSVRRGRTYASVA
jgi:hypothetical protein